MRVDRPDGISQSNRSHPFFIILRKFSDEQKETANVLTRDLLKGLALLISSFIISLIISILFYPKNLLLQGILLFIQGYVAYQWYRKTKNLLSQNEFETVEHMIFSNDYQLTNLNMESIINMISHCNRITGEMYQLQYTIKDGAIYGSILFVILGIYSIILHFI